MSSDPSGPIRYLNGQDVQALLPAASEQLDLVDRAYAALRAGAADTPATPELEPREGAFAHAMPAYIADDDITALKWISGNPSNRARGLPYLSGLIVVNDSDSGLPKAILDCAAITAARTAGVSAACVKGFARRGWQRVALVGFGVQARAHVRILRQLQPTASFAISSLHRPADLDDRMQFFDHPHDAVEGADVVVTGIPLDARLQPPINADWLAATSLVLPLDDDASLAADVVNRAQLFLVDDVDDFDMRRDVGRFGGWRAPDGTVAGRIARGQPASGVTVCANQGLGLLDALFANAVLAAAEAGNVGTVLIR